MTPAPRAYNSMITRCPSCAAQVSEEADRCPSCHWDFAAKSHGGGAGKLPAPAANKPPAPPPKGGAVPPPPSSKAETGQGLRQLPKIEGLKKTEAKPDDAPFALPTFEPPQSAKPAASDEPRAPAPSFGLPPAKSLPRTPPPEAVKPPPIPPPAAPEVEGPPVTEIRSASAPARRPEPAPPSPTPGRAPDSTRSKPSRGGLPWMAAGALLLTAGGYGAFKLVTQSSDTVGGKLSGQLRFTEGSDTVRLDAARLISSAQNAVSPPEPQRDIAQIQRVVVDPGNPNAVIRVPQAALIPPPTAAAPSSPPAPAKVAPGAPLPPLIPPPAPAATAKPQPPAPVAKAPAAPPPPPPPTPAASLPMHKPAAQAPGKPIEVAEPQTPTTVPKPALWVFEGLIYDLLTLSPVFDAEIRLLDASGKVVASATTADGGRYRLAAEASPKGYRAAVLHPDYQDKLLDEIAPPYREVDRRGRILAASTGASQRPWVGKVSGPERRDFVMIPKVLPDR